MTTMEITKPMMTMPSVEPTTETPFTVGVGVATCIASEDAPRFFADTFDCSTFAVAASTNTSTMNIKAIPKTCDVFIVICEVLYHAGSRVSNLHAALCFHNACIYRQISSYMYFFTLSMYNAAGCLLAGFSK